MKKLSSYPPRFWLLHLALPLVLAAFMVWVYPQTHLDFSLIAPYFDAQQHGFPLKRDWFIETVMHQWFKYIVVAISLVFLGLFVLSFAKRNSGNWIGKYRRSFIWTFVTMVIGTATISFLKSISNHSCPWDLALYGGSQPYLALFEALPTGAKAGHCFPGGHASAGFSLMAIYFAYRDSQPKFARIALIAGLLAGMVMGWGQMMRGAHFFSHNLWTAWVVWMLLLLLYLLWQPQKRAL